MKFWMSLAAISLSAILGLADAIGIAHATFLVFIWSINAALNMPADFCTAKAKSNTPCPRSF